MPNAPCADLHELVNMPDVPEHRRRNRQEALQQMSGQGVPPDIRILAMNGVFGIETRTQPTFLSVDRLISFKAIFSEELNEIDEVIKLANEYWNFMNSSQLMPADRLSSIEEDLRLKVLVAFGDLLGDFIVYVVSEMYRWGIPVRSTLKVIMESQESKLLDDNSVKWNEDRTKFLKGPNYQPPEPALYEHYKNCLRVMPEILTSLEYGSNNIVSIPPLMQEDLVY